MPGTTMGKGTAYENVSLGTSYQFGFTGRASSILIMNMMADRQSSFVPDEVPAALAGCSLAPDMQCENGVQIP
jgi:hypothetical protein